MSFRDYSVGTTEEVIVRAQVDRIALTIQNDHSTATIYVRDSKGVTSSNGISIYSNGSISMNLKEDGEMVKKEWWAVSDTASTTVKVAEGFPPI